MSKPYKLSACLYGHSLDVRSISITKDNSIISGSRDKSAKFWKPNGFNSGYSDIITYKDQKNFVASVLFLEPTTDFPEGLVITGGNDSCILVYKPSEPNAFCTIKEHKNTVSCLSKGLSPLSFLSGSWDTTAKSWNLAQSQTFLATYSGHKAAIWSVIQLQDARVVTASADKTIGVYSQEGKRLQTLEGHTDCVRGLCDMPDLGYFISVANDAIIKTWSYSGENLNSLYGHKNFIYSVARCKAGGVDCFVTSDEDRSVKVWHNGENTETIVLPAQSAWTVDCLSNGDIVVGSSDALVRIFTQDENRYADAETLNKFEEEVNALNKQNMQEIGGVKVSDLPGREALYDPGKRPGQMKMIRESGGVVAYTWVEEGESSHWEKVGEVLGSNDKQQEGTMYEGKSYDYVFSVDVEDGKPPLKLPYNKNDNPEKAAQAFLAKNNLPQAYLGQVIDFILKNSNTPLPANNEYVDPFTGASRYTPGSAQVDMQPQGTNFDPFTGGSSYSTASSASRQPAFQSSGGNADPFTGGSSYSTTGSSSQTKYFPHTAYLLFEVGKSEVVLNKLKEFNQKLTDVQGKVDENLLEDFVKLWDGPPSNMNTFDTLFKLLQWPEDTLFPVLDVVRMAVRHYKNNEVISTINSEILLPKLKVFISEQCKVDNNIIVAIRTLCNLCGHPPGENVIFENRFEIVENLTSLRQLNKNAQVALSTLLLNLSILCIKKNDELGIVVISEVLQDILTHSISDPESQFRAYVALGNLLSLNTPETKEIRIKLKTNSNFMAKIGEHHSSGSSELERKRMNCAQDVLQLLK